MTFDPPQSRHCYINVARLVAANRVHVSIYQGDVGYSTSLSLVQAESLAQQLLAACQEVRRASQPEQG